MVHCHSTRLTSHDLFHTIFLYRLQRLLVDRFNHDTIGMARVWFNLGGVAHTLDLMVPEALKKKVGAYALSSGLV